MKLTKSHINQTVWLVPTGNSINHKKGSAFQQAQEATITKMARIKGSLTFNGSSRTENFSICEYDDNEIDLGSNYGYIVFKNEDTVKEARRAEEVRSFIRTNVHKLSTEKLLAIGQLLEE